MGFLLASIIFTGCTSLESKENRSIPDITTTPVFVKPLTDTGLWTQVSAHAGWTPRTGQSVVALPDGSIVLMGGCDRDICKNDVWRSRDNGTTWTQITLGAAWPARGFHTSIVMPNGSIILMGGQGSSGDPKNDVW